MIISPDTLMNCVLLIYSIKWTTYIRVRLGMHMAIAAAVENPEST